MNPKELEVVAVDSFSGQEFVLYFSDDTYTSVSAHSLAECFPARQRIPVVDDEDPDIEELHPQRSKQSGGQRRYIYLSPGLSHVLSGF